jgi:polysaccharide biosynthesis transport protein
MTYLQLLGVLRARWLAALLTLLAVLTAAAATSMLMPKRYTATATVVVEHKSTDPISGLMLPGMLNSAHMATQVDIMKSGRVARRVITQLGLTSNDTLRAQWIEDTGGKGDFEGWVASLLRRNLEVKPARDSSALDVVYKSGDPRFSMTMANGFAQAYVDISLELRTDPARENNAFFDERAKQSREALEQAQGRLSAYQQAKGLLANDERFDVETARLQELSSQVVMLQALAAESSGRSLQASSSGDRIQEVVNNPLVAQLTADLARQQARLEELTSRLGDANPQVIELRASIAELRRRVQTESGRVAGSVNLNNNVAQGRLSQVQAALAEQRAKVLRLKQQRDEAAVLERDVESARQAYQMVLARVSMTGLESQARQSNVSLLERATEPYSPSSPNTVLHIAIAIFVGPLLAIVVAVLLELRDRRLRTSDDVTNVLDMPLVAVMPRIDLKRPLNKRQVRVAQERRLAIGPARA